MGRKRARLDDIRFEQQNKFSLIGCYGPDLILLQKPPVVLPKFCMVIQTRFPAEPRSPGKIVIYLPDGEEPLTTIEWEQEPEYKMDRILNPKVDKDVEIQRAFLFPCIFSPLLIQQSGPIRARMFYRSETIKLGAIQVVFKDESRSEPSAAASA